MVTTNRPVINAFIYPVHSFLPMVIQDGWEEYMVQAYDIEGDGSS